MSADGVPVIRYRYGRVPETILFDPSVSDRACRLFAMLTMRDWIEGTPTPAREQIAGWLRCSVDTVDRALRELARVGALHVIPRRDGRRQATSAYVLTGDGVQLSTNGSEPHRCGSQPEVQSRTGESLTGAAPIEAKGVKGLEGLQSKTETPPNPPQAGGRGKGPSPEETQVFDTWKAATERNGNTRLDRKRLAKIREALGTYPLGEVLDAVEGWQFVPHFRGENDRQTIFDELTLLLRDAEHIEKFRDATQEARARGEVAP